MHKIFGIKQNDEYLDREGAYLIPFCDDKVGVIKTPKGYFFLGGGLESGETHTQCLERECIEEAGYSVSVMKEMCSAETFCFHDTLGFFHPIQTYYIGQLLSEVSLPAETDHKLLWLEYDKVKGKLYWEMQNWALDIVRDYYLSQQSV